MPMTPEDAIRRLTAYDALHTLTRDTAKAAATHLETLMKINAANAEAIVTLTAQVRAHTDERHQAIAYQQRVAEAVVILNDVSSHDPEAAHAFADGVLLAATPVDLQAAYKRLRGRCSWWAAA